MGWLIALVVLVALILLVLVLPLLNPFAGVDQWRRERDERRRHEELIQTLKESNEPKGDYDSFGIRYDDPANPPGR